MTSLALLSAHSSHGLLPPPWDDLETRDRLAEAECSYSQMARQPLTCHRVSLAGTSPLLTALGGLFLRQVSGWEQHQLDFSLHHFKSGGLSCPKIQEIFLKRTRDVPQSLSTVPSGVCAERNHREGPVSVLGAWVSTLRLEIVSQVSCGLSPAACRRTS